MIGLVGSRFAEVDLIQRLARATGAAWVVVGVELSVTGVGVADGAIHVFRLMGGGGAVDGAVEVAHAGFLLRARAVELRGRIGRVLWRGGTILGRVWLGHGGSPYLEFTLAAAAGARER